MWKKLDPTLKMTILGIGFLIFMIFAVRIII